MKTKLTLIVVLTVVLSGLNISSAAEKTGIEAWHGIKEWLQGGNAELKEGNDRRLVKTWGNGVWVNGTEGKAKSLVTPQAYQDVEVHVEFMIAKGSNSGVIFHGNYEIQIRDTAHVKNPTGGDCGGVYPRATDKPKYHHIDKGSPPAVNAAKKPGQWQSYDIIFKSPRFKDGKKVENAKFVRVVHNGKVIQENVDVKYACGTNWDRPQRPRGPVIIQGDYGPIAVRNVRVKEWDGKLSKVEPAVEETAELNVPPKGFKALFNGKDLTGWHTHPRLKEFWKIEDGVLKSPALLKKWGVCLSTKEKFRDFELRLEFRMPIISDSGIHFRRLIPKYESFGTQEQFNLRSKGGMCHLESYYFLEKRYVEKHGLKESERPKVRDMTPKVGVWHKIRIRLIGRKLSAWYDGEQIYDNFQYHDWMINMEPAPIKLQKHKEFDNHSLGKDNPCPIEYRNIFIKKLDAADEPGGSSKLNVPPEGYEAVFNGKDLSTFHVNKDAEKMWKVEDGILKSPGLIKTYRGSLMTKKKYRDFEFLAEFRMPTISDSGIMFRRLNVNIEGFGNLEQFNLRSKGGMGHLESYYFLPKDVAKKNGLKESEKPHVKHIDPKVGVWHKIKLRMVGRTLSAWYDGEKIIDNFKYHDWMMSMEPSGIFLQKHAVVNGMNLGQNNPCPIEYRNVFVKDLQTDK